jgi:hypothetical protein
VRTISSVENVVERLIAVLGPDDVVIGGGMPKLKSCRSDVKRATTTTRSLADLDLGRSRAKLRRP